MLYMTIIPSQSTETTEPTEKALFDAIFRNQRTVAVVGLSPQPDRASYGVAAALQKYGWRIVPINPNAAQILGEVCYPSLADAALQVNGIALVNVFRRSAEVLPIAQAAIAIGAKGLWLQQGVRHDEAAALARAAGLLVVQDRCLKVEYRQWLSTQPDST